MKDKSSYKCLLVVTTTEYPRLFNFHRPVWPVCAKDCSLIFGFAATGSWHSLQPSDTRGNSCALGLQRLIQQSFLFFSVCLASQWPFTSTEQLSFELRYRIRNWAA